MVARKPCAGASTSAMQTSDAIGSILRHVSLMKRFSTSIDINASADKVWSLLTNAKGYTAWNSTVDKVDGEIAPGQKVTVYAKATPGRAFPLKVAEFDPGKRMVWSGGMPLGLFTGARSYTITPKGKAVSFSMTEEFSGLMAPLITRSIPDLQPAFDAFARDLKKAAEA